MKTPKKAAKAIAKLHYLVDQLEYFYFGRRDFKEVLDLASSIENTLHDLAINKKIGHQRIADRYAKHYEEKLIDITNIDTLSTDKLRERYKHGMEK